MYMMSSLPLPDAVDMVPASGKLGTMSGEEISDLAEVEGDILSDETTTGIEVWE